MSKTAALGYLFEMKYEIGQPLGKSDHVSILFEVKVCNSITNTVEDVKKRNWSKITDLNLLKSLKP